MNGPVHDRTTILWIGVGAAALFALVALASTLVPPRRSPGVAVGATPDSAGGVALLGRLPTRVPESSGAAVSRRHEGVFWTHNDRGRAPILYAVDLDGRLRGEFDLEGAGVGADLEALARGPCPTGGGECLYAADIGDNQASRSSVRILIVHEPEVLGSGSLRPIVTVELRYADGPADAEAFTVGPDGSGWIITKGQDGAARAYRVPRAMLEGGAADAPLEPTATLPIEIATGEHRVTGAATSPDGGTVAIRTGRAVYLFDPATWSAPVVCPFPDLQPQPEAIDYLGDDTFLLTSESRGEPAPIHRVRCP